jgi:hypothetical protein
MTATKRIGFGTRFLWAYDVAAGVFLKHLIDAAEASGQTNAPWLARAVSDWRVQAAITECGLTLDENWSNTQRLMFIRLAEAACKELATRASIPAEEIVDWPLGERGELRIFPRGAREVLTEPVIELGRAIIALVSGELPQSPQGEAWFYGLPTGRSTIRMEPSWTR